MTSVVRRSTGYSVAAIINLVLSVLSIVFTLGPIFQGSADTAAAGDQPPFGIIVLSFALGIVGIVASYGVWKVQRWGVVLCIVVNAVAFLSGLPGVFFGPTLFLIIGSIVFCAGNVAVIVLLLRRRAADAAVGVAA